MADIAHSYGYDIQVDATGDILVSSGSQLGQERVLRRLLTSTNAYLWAQTYGAGLSQFLGGPAASTRIAAVVRAQMSLEAAVAQIPAPLITVNVRTDSKVFVNIRYVDAQTGDPVALFLPIGE